MVRQILILIFLLGTVLCEAFSGSKRTLRQVYKPYGPRMCSGMLKVSSIRFSYTSEDLSCRQIMANVSSVKEQSSAMLERETEFKHSPFLRNNSHDKAVEESVPKSAQWLVSYSLNTTLHQACKQGRLDAVRYILSEGLEDINKQGEMERTPVMVAVRNGQLAVFNFLVSKDCDLSFVDKYNNNVLDLACMGGNIDIVKKLTVNEKVNIDSRGWQGRTPLMWAVYNGHMLVYGMLIAKGCNKLREDSKGNNVLHVACKGGHVNMVKYILSQNFVDKEGRGECGRTPMMVSACEGRLGVYKLLTDKGCSMLGKDRDGNNILHLACVGGDIDMVTYILSRDIFDKDSEGHQRQTPVMMAAARGHKEVVGQLVRKGCNMKIVDMVGNRVIHRACTGGHVSMVRFIISMKLFGIDIRGQLGRTPAMIAVEFGHRDVLDLLMSKGCNLKLTDYSGNNILHVACFGGHVDIVKYLLTLSIVNVTEKNKYGITPLQMAQRKGHKVIVSLLKDSLE